MPQAKQVSERKRRIKAVPVLGAAGLLALASGTSAKAVVSAPAPTSGMSYQFLLGEEEISDVSLSTFLVFDRENVGSLKPHVQLARAGGCGGGGCRDAAAVVEAGAADAPGRAAAAFVG
jgi:hypothetical protein